MYHFPPFSFFCLNSTNTYCENFILSQNCYFITLNADYKGLNKWAGLIASRLFLHPERKSYTHIIYPTKISFHPSVHFVFHDGDKSHSRLFSFLALMIFSYRLLVSFFFLFFSSHCLNIYYTIAFLVQC